MNYAFKWFVNGLQVVEFDGASQPMFLECPRGTQPGRACFWLRRDDADSLFATPDATYAITAEVYRRDDGPWALVDTVTFLGYIACERSEWDALTDGGNVYVTLKDQRHKIARSSIDRIWNSVYLVALTAPTGTRTLYTIYEPKNCASGSPYSYTEIVTALLAPSGLGTVSLPLSRPAPDNILTRGSCSDVLAGLLASLGCDMVYDPYGGSLSIVKLSDSQTLTELIAAKTDGRLLSTVTQAIDTKDLTGEVIATPADYFPIRHVKQDIANFGTGKKSIVIRDHQLADETTSMVAAARMTQIKQAVQDYHLAEIASFDETYFGVVKATPSAGLRSLTFLITGHEDAGGQVCTRAVNDCLPMPWIDRAEHVYPVMIEGLTVATLTSSAVSKIALTNAPVAGKYFEAKGKGSDVASGSEVVAWPIVDSFLALKVC